jgi:hypothetical protein
MGKMVGARAGAGAEIFDNLELKPHKNNRPALQHWININVGGQLPDRKIIPGDKIV